MSFELHNRQMYSAELERSGRAYTRALATIVAAGLDGTVLQRNAVLSEFRTESDLIERIAGGAGPAGVKAVAPVGTETVVIDVPEEYDAIALVGESLSLTRSDGNETVRAPGRPIAVVSGAQISTSRRLRRSRRRRRRNRRGGRGDNVIGLRIADCGLRSEDS